MKNRFIILGLLLAVLVITALIFVNSLDTVDESNQKSDNVTDVVENVTGGENGESNLNVIVRKSAHVIEFALLGAALAFLLYYVKLVHNKRLYGVGAFYALAVAVVDEYIQTFSDRSGSVSDIMLDFCGVLIGVVLALIIPVIVSMVKKHKQKAEAKANATTESTSESDN